MSIKTKYILKKLSKKNTRLYQKNKKAKKYSVTQKNTIFILDWDDTLYPTYWKNNNEVQNLVSLDKYICSFINKINSLGKIKIVSNANLAWIDLTLNNIPRTKKLLKNKKIQIFSARDKYEKKYHLKKWKKYAFRYLINKNMKGFLANIFSIGDRKYEHKALTNLSKVKYINKKNRIMYLKSIKLQENPNYQTLVNQIKKLKKIIKKSYLKRNNIYIKNIV